LLDRDVLQHQRKSSASILLANSYSWARRSHDNPNH
jgi:hypothetical protein